MVSTIGVILCAVLVVFFGASEIIGLLLFCASILFVIIYDARHKEKEEFGNKIELSDFFDKGGYAIFWNKGDCERKRCDELSEFLKIKADYVELWLDGVRFIFDNSNV